MSFATLYGTAPSDAWAKFSDGAMKDALEALLERYEAKDSKLYKTGHLFVSVRQKGTADKWERAALLEFPGVYATTLPDELARAVEQKLAEAEP